MCDYTQGFKLCSCANEPAVHNKNSRRAKKNQPKEKPLEYTWHLLRYVETVDTGVIGRVIMPTDDIGSGLTEEEVHFRLNTENCFDFDYTPQDRDCLMIQPADNWGRYLAFTYRNGEWIIGRRFDAFDDIMENVGKGKLKPVNQDISGSS